jgi:hypothetical protein
MNFMVHSWLIVKGNHDTLPIISTFSRERHMAVRFLLKFVRHNLPLSKSSPDQGTLRVEE